jgi:hypothetical protein
VVGRPVSVEDAVRVTGTMDCCFDFSRKNMSSRKMENDKYAEANITKAIMAIVVPARTNTGRGRIAFYSILKATREFDGRTLLA